MHICIVNLHFTLALQRKKYSGGKADMTIMDAIFMLNNLIDESDPDTAEPNSFHLFQTAERIRQVHPDKGISQFGNVLSMMITSTEYSYYNIPMSRLTRKVCRVHKEKLQFGVDR
jgi:hypothetical protein